LKKQRSKSRKIRCSTSVNKKSGKNQFLKIRQIEKNNIENNNDIKIDNNYKSEYMNNKGIFILFYLILF
jgi:hypothetical protein